jgi:hypothetical protein
MATESLGVSDMSWGYPKNAGWFMENAITKMDDDWGYPHDMSETSIFEAI